MDPIFSELTEEWFSDHGVTDPKAAFQSWQEFLASHPKRRRRSEKYRRVLYRKLLEIGSGLSYSAISHYLNGRTEKLGQQTLATLDLISEALGEKPPERGEVEDISAKPASVRRQVLLLAELHHIPSPPYHLQVIRQVIRGVSGHNVTATLFEVSQTHLSLDVERAVRLCRPDGVVMLRLTPDRDVTRILEKYNVPTVLIHADRVDFESRMILTNIAPKQKPLEQFIKGWIQEIPDEGPPVLVSMEPDDYEGEFKLLRHPSSIRAERIEIVRSALEEYDVRWVRVNDYSFRHALRVFQEVTKGKLQEPPDARCYICLSDEIAIGLKHLFLAIGNEQHASRIIGFDGSELADLEAVSTIDQDFVKIGEIASTTLVNALAQPPNKWDFDAITETNLNLRTPVSNVG